MYDFVNNRLPRSFDNTLKYNRNIQETRFTRQADLLHMERGKIHFLSTFTSLQFTSNLEQMEAHVMPHELYSKNW